MTVRTSKVVQVSNIAPQVTKDQMHAMFSFLGKIEDIQLYPTIRVASFPIHSRICYIKFAEASTVSIAQHMTNTVFIDRALIVIPMSSDEIPDECYVLEMTQHGAIVPGLRIKDPKLPPHVVNSISDSGEGQVVVTTDTNLASNGLPPYPPVPASFDPAKIEECRRTILMLNYNPASTIDEVIDFLTPAGEVKCMRTCKRESGGSANMLVEFTDQPSVVNALKMNGMDFKGRPVEIQHATQPIIKPQINSDELVQQEIEDAAARFQEEQCMMAATRKPVASMPTKDKRRSRSRSSGRRKRSRSTSRSRRRSRSRKRRSTSRKRRSTSRKRRSTSRRRRSSSHRRYRSRSRGRSNSRKPESTSVRRASMSRRRRSSSREEYRSSRRSRSGDRNRRSSSTSKNDSRYRYRRSSSRSSNLRKSKERSYRIQSRRDSDGSRERKRGSDEDRKSRRQEVSKDIEREKDAYSSSKGNLNKRRTDNKSKEDSEKVISRSRSKSRSRDRKKRDRQRSRSGGSRRRSPSPRISRKRKNRSKSRERDRKRDKKSYRRDKDRN